MGMPVACQYLPINLLCSKFWGFATRKKLNLKKAITSVALNWHFILKFKMYSKLPILRPPLGLFKSGLKDHFWIVSKVVSNQRYTGYRK